MEHKWHIFLANLDPAVGSEQGKTRPVLIISEEEINQILPVLNVLPITSRKVDRRIYPNEVLIPAHTGGIQVTGMLIVNRNAADNLTVKYGNFSSGDASDIKIYRDTNGNGNLDIPGDDEVYTQTDALDGSPEQVVPVEWTPLSGGLHWVLANGDTSGIVVMRMWKRI